MTESKPRLQLSDKLNGAIGVATGDDPTVVASDLKNLMDAYKAMFEVADQPAQQISAAQQMVQRPVNQPGGLGATPVAQSGGGDLQPCPNGGSPHQFKQGFSQRTQKNWKAWECGDKRCDMDGRGGNRAWLR